MSFYTALQATATAMIASKGMAMTLVSKSAAAYDTATGLSQETAVSSAVVGVSLEYPARQIDGANVLRTDKRVLLGAGGTKPKVTDGLIVLGVLHKIMDCKTIAPAGEVVMYIVQAREGG